jgi:uncharacterized protein YgiM (DUF1202 family)
MHSTKDLHRNGKKEFGIMTASKRFTTGIALVALSFLTSPQTTSAAPADWVIGLEEAPIRQTANYLAKVVGKAKYGTKLAMTGKNGQWILVTHGNTKGWIHMSAFAKADDVMSDIGKGEAASKSAYGDEVATAGKGFNPEFETAYRKENPTLDYAAVDTLDARTVTPEKIAKFAADGQLKSSGGKAP